ncbi:MAG: hypothetical protein V4753_04385 [Pseudomonadota bacterium]
MANNINIGDEVYVCSSRLPTVNDQTKAFYKSEVTGRQNRSVSVRLRDGTNSQFVSTKFVRRRVGVAVVAFGDFDSENTLLDPLAKTVLQYCRLLFGDDHYVRFIKLRTEAELNLICDKRQLSPYEHIVILGHGSAEGALCGATGDVSATRLREIFEQHGPSPWDFVFLCCYLGRNAFARSFSESPCCRSLVAPFNAVHGAVSAQFVQTYLIKLLLEGETTAVAHRHASESTPPGSQFRLWRSGVHEA